MWQALWKIKVLVAVKHLLWHACYIIIPTRLNLVKRMISDQQSALFALKRMKPLTMYYRSARQPAICGERKGVQLRNEGSTTKTIQELWTRIVEKLPQISQALRVIIVRNL